MKESSAGSVQRRRNCALNEEKEEQTFSYIVDFVVINKFVVFASWTVTELLD
jgi:hypothetical protein